jgi:hypothetical protein
MQMIWTKTWPKVPGWYWRKCTLFRNPSEHIEYVDKDQSIDMAYCEGCWWCPIPKPKHRKKL